MNTRERSEMMRNPQSKLKCETEQEFETVPPILVVEEAKEGLDDA